MKEILNHIEECLWEYELLKWRIKTKSDYLQFIKYLENIANHKDSRNEPYWLWVMERVINIDDLLKLKDN